MSRERATVRRRQFRYRCYVQSAHNRAFSGSVLDGPVTAGLQQELDRLLGELAELDRCSARRGSDAANLSLITIARRGTNLAIAEVRSLMARRSSLH
jgi:hypothetical protein